MYHEVKTGDLTPIEREKVGESLLKGVVSRASIICFLYAISFGLYAFTSFEFLHHFDPSLTLFENTWPRILFNVLPFVAMGFYFRDYQSRPSLKAWIWAVGMPVIFVCACLIHVWPLIWNGWSDLYLYVHAANLFVIATTFIVVSPPPRLMLTQASIFVTVFLVPVGYLLLRSDAKNIFSMAMGDFFIAFSVTIYSSYMVFRLRNKIAILDLRMKKAASPFLGVALTEAIYKQRTELLQNRRARATILKIDIRGYTEFYRKNDQEFVRGFMTGYHGIVSRFVGQTGGYWHKSIGDGQLASYGAMNPETDLSDVPGIEAEVAAAERRKGQDQFDRALMATASISEQFEKLKEEFDVKDELSLGMAIARGDVEIRVQGDGEHRMELDIDGEVVLRCSRLETYTKTIQKELKVKASVVVLSPELSEFADSSSFKPWSTITPDRQVRSFPEIALVHFRVFDRHVTRESPLTLFHSRH